MKLAQTLNYLLSLLALLIMGALFAAAFHQVDIRMLHLPEGRPAPVLTEFFVERSSLTILLPLFPWIWMVGAPLRTLSTARKFWDPNLFALRYFAFLSVEVLVFLVLTLAVALPAIPYYRVIVMRDENESSFSLTTLIFIGLVVVILIAAIFRSRQIRREGRRSEADGVSE